MVATLPGAAPGVADSAETLAIPVLSHNGLARPEIGRYPRSP
ncbi:hypothetical protein [Nocardia xishanensis]|uniref:Uncharacterized protein n=1 Tax=Nocardia xishanensis TaxID=238964 RepID=A0ABW7WTU1_9NOCA